MQRDEWKKPEQQEKLQEKMLKIFWLKSSLCVERASAAVIVPSYRSYSLSVCSCNYRYYSGILITVSNTAVSSTSTADLSRLCTAPALFRSLSTHTHTHTHTHTRTHTRTHTHLPLSSADFLLQPSCLSGGMQSKCQAADRELLRNIHSVFWTCSESTYSSPYSWCQSVCLV